MHHVLDLLLNRLQAIVGTFNRIFLNYWCGRDESFFGLGVQYSHFNMKGRRVPIGTY